MQSIKIVFIDTRRTLNIKVGKEAVNVACDTVLFCGDTVETENGDGCAFGIKLDALMCLVLNMINFYLLKN